MKANKSRLRFSTALFKGAYVHNPVLTQLSGLCPIIMAATSFKNAAYLSLCFTLLLVVNEALASAFFKGFSRWVRVCFYALVSSVALIPVLSKMNPEAAAALGVYLPLLCVNAVIVIRCEKFSIRTGIINSVLDALATSVGFGVVALITGIIREFISKGSLFGLEKFPKIPSIAMPFAGLVILGFLAAVQKWSVLKFYPDELVDTFSMKDAFDKPLLSDPGLNTKAERKNKRRLKDDESEYDEIRPRYSIEDVESTLEKRREQQEEKEDGKV